MDCTDKIYSADLSISALVYVVPIRDTQVAVR
jgi:hypothetical protein